MPMIGKQECAATRDSAAVRERIMHLLQISSLFLVFVSAATGCTAMNDPDESRSHAFRSVQSTAEAKKQLAGWIAPNAPVNNAMRMLEEQGFVCHEATPQSQGVQRSVSCFYQAPPLLPPEQRLVAPMALVNWMIVLDSEDGATVSSFQVSRSPGDP